eukprot:maker-scaffold_13-augustus-gene-8.10-mRNA-1 protein AED:0.26 eAED:0.30 QI:0/0/0/0.5/1/0.5/2/0/1178
MQSDKDCLHYVQSEIHNVLSTLRRHGRWSSPERFNQETPLQLEPPLIRSFKSLHSLLQTHTFLSDVDSLTYFQPFLELIISPSTNGYITGRSLTAVNKFLLYGTLNKDSPNVKNTINFAVASVVECQFESTNEYSDEVVLMQLLEVLQNLVRCPAGEYISDGNIWRMIKVCWKIQKDVNNVSTVLLKSTAANTLTHLVLSIFTRSNELITQESLKQYYLRYSLNQEEETISLSKKTGYSVFALLQILKFLCELVDVNKNKPATRAFALQLVNICLETGGEHLGIVYKSESFTGRSPIIDTLQGDLCKYLLQNSQSNDMAILSLTLRVVFNLFYAMKGHLKTQLEVFLVSIHLRLSTVDAHTLVSTKAPGLFNGSPMNNNLTLLKANEAKELALESLLDFCREPRLMLDLYVNYDCDMHCSNLFETLVNSLCSASYPPKRPQNEDGAREKLNSLHLLSLEGILIILKQMASSLDEVDEPGNESTYRANSRLTEDEMVTDNSKLKAQKALKRRLQLAAKEFNRKPLKNNWIKYAQDMELLPPAGDPQLNEKMASFLLTCPGINKEALGEYLGSEVHTDECSVLNEYIKSFDLKDLRIDLALRKVLDKFKLPGEAQKVDRLMDAFGSHIYEQNKENENNVFAEGDAAFTLAFSIIMLHTDLHNPAIKPERKMTLQQFIRNNRGINKGSDFSPEFLEEIYVYTKEHEMQLRETNSENFTAENFASGETNNLVSVGNQNLDILSDMFEIMFEPCLKCLLFVMKATNDGRVIFKILNAFKHLSKLIIHLKNQEAKLDNLVSSICALVQAFFHKSNLSNLNVGPTEAESKGLSLIYSSSNEEKIELYVNNSICRTILLFKLLLKILTKPEYAAHLQASWVQFVRCFLLLNTGDLLPDIVSSESSTSLNQQKLRIRHTPSSETTKATSNFWNALSSLIFDDDDLVNVELEERLKRAEEFRTLFKKILVRANIKNLFNGLKLSAHLKHASSVRLLNALASCLSDIIGKKETEEKWMDVVLVLNLMTQLVISYPVVDLKEEQLRLLELSVDVVLTTFTKLLRAFDDNFDVIEALVLNSISLNIRFLELDQEINDRAYNSTLVKETNQKQFETASFDSFNVDAIDDVTDSDSQNEGKYSYLNALRAVTAFEMLIYLCMKSNSWDYIYSVLQVFVRNYSDSDRTTEHRTL